MALKMRKDWPAAERAKSLKFTFSQSLEEKNGVMYVKDDFILSTVDIVQDPSAPTAFVNGIMEGTEWVYDDKFGWIAQEFVEETSKKLQNKYKGLTEESKLQIFNEFLNRISLKK